MEKIKVFAKYVDISPRKIRPLSDLLVGKDAEKTLTYLKFETKYAALPIAKLLKSAISAAENKNLDAEKLIISEIRIDNGPVRKKQRVRSRGRADLQKKRTSHILLVLEEKASESKVKKVGKEKITKTKKLSKKK